MVLYLFLIYGLNMIVIEDDLPLGVTLVKYYLLLILMSSLICSLWYLVNCITFFQGTQ